MQQEIPIMTNIKNCNKQEYCTERQGSYILNQRLSIAESHRLEFKNYGLPFTHQVDFSLQKTICSFLNRSGGTILIGVDDERVVQGIKIKNIDEVKKHFDQLKKTFYPYPEGFITTAVLPIKECSVDNQEEYNWLPNIYIIRIEVGQGLEDRLYSYTVQEKYNVEKRYSSFREDASIETIDTFEKIYDKACYKAARPSNKAERILYEEPDQGGLSESSSTSSKEDLPLPDGSPKEQPFISFTNIHKNFHDQFVNFIENNLHKQNYFDFEIERNSEYIIILKSPRIKLIHRALKESVKTFKNLITVLTYKGQPLQYGYLKSMLTIKNLDENQQNEMISSLPNLEFDHKLKDNGELLILTSRNMGHLPDFYSHCKKQRYSVYLQFQ